MMKFQFNIEYLPDFMLILSSLRQRFIQRLQVSLSCGNLWKCKSGFLSLLFVQDCTLHDVGISIYYVIKRNYIVL